MGESLKSHSVAFLLFHNIIAWIFKNNNFIKNYNCNKKKPKENRMYTKEKKKRKETKKEEYSKEEKSNDFPLLLQV